MADMKNDVEVPYKPDDFELAIAEMVDKAQKCVVDPLTVAAQWKDELLRLAKGGEPASEDLDEELEDFLGKNELLNCCYSTRDTLRLATKVANHFVNWQKQQMMKDAVPGRISVNRFGNKVVSSWPGIQQLKLLHTFDKVKLIIIKED